MLINTARSHSKLAISEHSKRPTPFQLAGLSDRIIKDGPTELQAKRKGTEVSRHREIVDELARKICKDLEILALRVQSCL
jgi:hypothetical protein